MGVYFVYRCHYNSPSEKYIKRFDDATVLDWFRNRWQRLANADRDTAYNRVEEELGCTPNGFGWLFLAAGEHSLPVPESHEQFNSFLADHLYVESECDSSAHVLQVLTDEDDDEIQMAYYFFDDHFIRENGNLASFLLREDWRLPTEFATAAFVTHEPTIALEPAGKGDGTTYVAILAADDADNLDGIIPAYRIDGVRLPDFPRYLASTSPTDDWPLELCILRSRLFAGLEELGEQQRALVTAIYEDPADHTAWWVYADWFSERGLPGPDVEFFQRALSIVDERRICNVYANELNVSDLAAATKRAEELGRRREDGHHDPSKSRIAVSQHLAQVSLHELIWNKFNRNVDMYQQWIIFDDCWVSANRDLANGILRFASRWDVLTPE